MAFRRAEKEKKTGGKQSLLTRPVPGRGQRRGSPLIQNSEQGARDVLSRAPCIAQSQSLFPQLESGLQNEVLGAQTVLIPAFGRGVEVRAPLS